jgi:hypothetical protein
MRTWVGLQSVELQMAKKLAGCVGIGQDFDFSGMQNRCPNFLDKQVCSIAFLLIHDRTKNKIGEYLVDAWSAIEEVRLTYI